MGYDDFREQPVYPTPDAFSRSLLPRDLRLHTYRLDFYSAALTRRYAGGFPSNEALGVVFCPSLLECIYENLILRQLLQCDNAPPIFPNAVNMLIVCSLSNT